ncbi:Nucleotide-binding universal stress protein, UspA family [Desulfocicer vacuolatum DSM 3385]|uniref:Nucleotide-binding universal stress protein, UspA family n=1 Tax=Desulfocicer vacuolatum DSM 3385 TaxID=1121400 RepID=A0A1W2AHA7_9BACT|nr:universal stress protein [Desulfocicer vacuolatum]SMC59648.1 Nucleotide-binding universal stress protein, UspA family [Desulfocicer vacuolatum DSM 3385]
MKKIKKILVCIDLSDYSLTTLQSAITIAENSGAEIHIINVINQRDISVATMVPPYYSGSIDVDGYIKKTTEDRKAGVTQLIDNHFSDFKSAVTIHIKTGTPFEEIIQTAVSQDVDFIVMGNKGRSNLSKTLFGSQAEKVFRHSPVPVFSVRSGQHKRQVD